MTRHCVRARVCDEIYTVEIRVITTLEPAISNGRDVAAIVSDSNLCGRGLLEQPTAN